MRSLILVALATSTAALAACETAPAPGVAVAGGSSVCGTYGYVDANNDGFISNAEWTTFGTRTYGDWDLNHDGRVDRGEFESCYKAGGFYRTTYYKPDYWTNYWQTFDVNNDGYLSANEYWSATTWSRVDRNGNGRIDSDEWVWWTP